MRQGSDPQHFSDSCSRLFSCLITAVFARVCSGAAEAAVGGADREGAAVRGDPCPQVAGTLRGISQGLPLSPGGTVLVLKLIARAEFPSALLFAGLAFQGSKGKLSSIQLYQIFFTPLSRVEILGLFSKVYKCFARSVVVL